MQTIVSSDIELASKLLLRGEVIAIPTETVYGLAGRIDNELSIETIFSVKQRPHFNPLIVHISNLSQLDKIVKAISTDAKKLIDMFWPGPLTLLFEKRETVSDLVTGGLSTVAVRMPKHAYALELIEKVGTPLAAPSANPFGYVSPTSPAHVYQQLQGKIPLILDGGKCSSGIESTIVDTSSDVSTILRYGVITPDEIESITGQRLKKVEKTKKVIKAPGMLLQHYSPHTPVLLGKNLDELFNLHTSKKVGALVFSTSEIPKDAHAYELLSANGDMHEIAKNLFAGLRSLDNQELDVIICRLCPNEGVGLAINDRLQRAAAK